jgi:multidrug efflux pump subunit AcrA (membrane-fusion protein)
MLARVHLPIGEASEAVIVPKDAVVTKGRDSSVFRIGSDELVEQVPVTVGSAVGMWVAVDGDVKPGDRLITRGNERIFPGQTVVSEPQAYPLP